ncbi:hypothetical protein JMF97_26010 [Micromonospora fiedleri]|uniref:Uncharacterized protein n=1 Tax=Micromonospora fiedleri TaxID=1157498 RepID=A0ABS1UTC6_9ACTN|nr:MULTISPECIES: hypothetical protein [Micromonospora]MBL6279615.1 hypothetical protein [Micromonospora fiedleri]RUL91919.1 hypothetical protein EG812_18405 [Verrucosispora sp. FIM060022]
MTYPDPGGANNDFYTDPPPPRTARELVDQLGIEEAREFLPEAQQQAFDNANPWTDIERANNRLEQRQEELAAFDGDVQRHITEQGYTAEQARIVYAQTADVRQPLQDAVNRAGQRARNAYNTYEANLVNFIESRRLTQIVAYQSGRYSMQDPRVAAAASLSSSGNNRHDRRDRRDRDGRGGGRAPLGQISGNQRHTPAR